MSEITLQLANSTPLSAETAAPTGNNSARDHPILGQFNQLSPEEIEKVAVLISQIDLQDPISVVRYGETIQKQIEPFINDVLKIAIKNNTEEVNVLLQNLTDSINAFNDRISQLILSPSKRSKVIRQEYDKTSVIIERTKKQLDGRQMKLLVNIRTLSELRQQLLAYYRELTIYTVAGQQKLSSTQTGQSNSPCIPDLPQILAARKPDDEHRVFKERLRSLDLSRIVASQALVQTQLILTTDQLLTQHIQNSISNSISLWKQNIAAVLSARLNTKVLQASNTELLTAINNVRIVQKEGCEERAKAVLIINQPAC